jgi:hypothetical protein
LVNGGELVIDRRKSGQITPIPLFSNDRISSNKHEKITGNIKPNIGSPVRSKNKHIGGSKRGERRCATLLECLLIDSTAGARYLTKCERVKQKCAFYVAFIKANGQII